MKTLIECIIQESGNTICKEEEGKKICFVYDEYEMVCDAVPIDKCVFNKVKGVRKCDFLFLFDKNKQKYTILDKSIAYYVELKGVDLIYACEQIWNSIDKTKDQIEEFDINAIVVSSRAFIPKYDNNEFYRSVKRLIKKNIQFRLTPFIVEKFKI